MKKIILIGLFLLNIQAFASLKFIETWFCNNTDWNQKTLEIFWKDWINQNACYFIHNKSNKLQNINIYFVDGIIDPNSPLSVNCKLKDDPKTNLAKYSQFWAESLSIAPWDTIKKYIKFNFDSSKELNLYWCAIAEVPLSNTWTSGIKIQKRKWNIVKVINNYTASPKLINWDLSQINNQSDLNELQANIFNLNKNNDNIIYRNLKVRLVKKEDNYQLETDLYNIWNTDIFALISHTLSNSLGFKEDISTKEVIYPWESKTIRSDINLPTYKGNFDINSTISFSPSPDYLAFNTTWLLDIKTESAKWSFFLFPSSNLLIIMIILIIIIWTYGIYKLIKRHKYSLKINI